MATTYFNICALMQDSELLNKISNNLILLGEITADCKMLMLLSNFPFVNLGVLLQ